MERVTAVERTVRKLIGYDIGSFSNTTKLPYPPSVNEWRTFLLGDRIITNFIGVQMFYLTDGISRIYTTKGWKFCYQGHTYGEPVIFANYDEAIKARDANPCPYNRPSYPRQFNVSNH